MTQLNNEAFEKWFQEKFPNAKDQERKWFTSMGWQAAKADSASEIAELKDRLHEIALDWQVNQAHINVLREALEEMERINRE